MMLPRTIHIRLLVALFVVFISAFTLNSVPASAQVACGNGDDPRTGDRRERCLAAGSDDYASKSRASGTQMSVVSDERGEYRVTPLPIGIYTVDYELSGFQTLRLSESA